jgi:hypothetical protein
MKEISVIVLLFECALAAWTTPVKLIKSEGYIKSYNTFTEENGNTHVVYCAEVVNNTGDSIPVLVYALVDSKDNLQKEHKFTIKSGCVYVSVTVDSDHETVIIAFEGQRVFNAELCNEKDTKGCHDIFTVVSKNLGATWDNIEQLLHEDLDDAVERTEPHVSYNKKAQATFLYFIKEKVSSAKSLYFSIRKDTEEKFTKELGAINNELPVKKLISVFTTKERRTWITHVFYDSYDTIIHVEIADINTWTYYDDTFDKTKQHKNFIAGIGVETSMIAVIYTDGKKTYFKYSPNHGVHWSKEYLLFEEVPKNVIGAFKPGAKKDFEMLLLTSESMNRNRALYSVTFPTVSIKSLPLPFVDMINFGIFKTQLDQHNEKKGVRAYGYIWTNEIIPAIYFSDYSA